jgi:hypothetical protein
MGNEYTSVFSHVQISSFNATTLMIRLSRYIRFMPTGILSRIEISEGNALFGTLHIIFILVGNRFAEMMSLKLNDFVKRLFIVGILSRMKDRLCDLVARALGYRWRGPGSIPGATIFSEK